MKLSEQTNYRFFLSLLFRILVLTGFLFVVAVFIMSVFDTDKSLKSNNNKTLSVSLSGLQSGEFKKIKVGYIPVWIYKRRDKEIEQLSHIRSLLVDPLSNFSIQPEAFRNDYRSRSDRYFVFKPVESIRSCSVWFLEQPETELTNLLSEISENWLGGFTESCFGSVYDLSGRRFKGSGKDIQKNLNVPEYTIKISKQQSDVIQFEFKSMVVNP